MERCILNHQPQEGEFIQRRKDAIKAFHEWLPIRDNMVETGEITEALSLVIYSSFDA